MSLEEIFIQIITSITNPGLTTVELWPGICFKETFYKLESFLLNCDLADGFKVVNTFAFVFVFSNVCVS